MRRTGIAVGTAWAAAVALTGCGGDGDAGPAAASAKPRVLTAEAVRGDLRAALEEAGFGKPTFDGADSEQMRKRPCQVAGRLRTSTAPDREAAERAVAEMDRRGWKVSEGMPDDHGVGWALDQSGWSVSFVSGEAGPAGSTLLGELLAHEGGEAGDFQGLAFYGFGQNCGETAATASP
ncbi:MULTISPECIES: hypothetical protein [unclassified Streptomyces]|uniref:hypothetical protein n=1 Tax=unclassified Streptomyces TaxID=2593676 RepID=UPI0036E0F607